MAAIGKAQAGEAAIHLGGDVKYALGGNAVLVPPEGFSPGLAGMVPAWSEWRPGGLASELKPSARA